jgi:hypothetical protein
MLPLEGAGVLLDDDPAVFVAVYGDHVQRGALRAIRVVVRREGRGNEIHEQPFGDGVVSSRHEPTGEFSVRVYSD